MHQREKKGIGQYADTGTGEYKTETKRTSSDFAEEIAWREEIDKQVYEDRKSIINLTTENKGGRFDGGGSGSDNWFNPLVETKSSSGSYLDEYILTDDEQDELLNKLDEENDAKINGVELDYWTEYEGTKKNIQENYNYYMMETARTQPLYTTTETAYNVSKQKAAAALRRYIMQNLPIILSAASIAYLAKEAIAAGGAIAGTAALATIEGLILYIAQLAQEIGAEELANMGYDLYDIINEGKNVKALYNERNKAGDVFSAVKEKHDNNVKWKKYYKDILNDFDNWYKKNYGTNEIIRAEKRY